jgi:hypothetical protein
MDSWEERAIQEVTSKNDLPSDAITRIYGTIQFLDGRLTTINYKRQHDDSEWQENYYYEAGNDRQFFFCGPRFS